MKMRMIRRAAARGLAVACAIGALAMLAPAVPMLAPTLPMPASDTLAAEEPAAVIEPVAATGGVLDVLYIRPFTLQEPVRYTWTREQPEITAGVLLVLEVRPELVLPREVDVPVLFAGDTPVHLTNTGYPSGRLVVLVPDWIAPGDVPFYFGSTELPERITRERGAAEAAAAIGQGARPFPAERIARARAAGGDSARFAGPVALFRAAADLIDAYAPDEAEKAANYRTKLVTE